MPAVRRWVSVAANSQTVGIMLGSPGTPVCHGHVSEPATPSWHEATFRWDSPVNRRDQTAAETKRKGVVKSDGKKSGHRSVAAFSLSDAAAMAASCYRRLCRSSSAGHGTFAGGRGEPFASGTLSPVTAWHFPASLGAAIPSALVAHCRSDSMSQERLGRGSVRSDPGIRSGMGPTQPAASVVTATRTNVRRRRTVWSRVEVMAITPEVGATGRLPRLYASSRVRQHQIVRATERRLRWPVAAIGRFGVRFWRALRGRLALPFRVRPYLRTIMYAKSAT